MQNYYESVMGEDSEISDILVKEHIVGNEDDLIKPSKYVTDEILMNI
jgi:uncharacterized metal-binding protein YceD (DUF177 family)